MANVVRKFNFGTKEKEQNPELYNQLSSMYEGLALAVNDRIAKRVIAAVSPPANDVINRNFEIGDIWVRTGTNQAWIMTSRTSDVVVVWTVIT